MDKMLQHWVTPLAAQIADARAQHNHPDAGVTVSEWPVCGYLIVRGKSTDAAFVAAAESVGKLAWPLEPRSSANNEDVRVLWLSPDEWAVITEYAALSHYMNGFEQAFSDVSAQVVDNSGGITGLRLEGKDTLMVLRHLTPYDVEALKPGDCVGTVMSQAHVLLHCRNKQCYEVIVRRSFADYIWRLLLKASRPYGLGIK